MGEPMKEKELREMVTCLVCRKKIGETQLPILWKVKAERHGLDAKALQRQTGLAMMLGGNGLIAHHMGPNEDMTKVLSEKACMVCDECMVKRLPELFDDEGEEECQTVRWQHEDTGRIVELPEGKDPGPRHYRVPTGLGKDDDEYYFVPDNK